MNVVVAGSLGFDYIMDFAGRFADRIMADKIHKISLSFLVDTFKKQFGGTAGNIAYTLKLLDIEPSVLAPAGNDFSPYREFFAQNNIATNHILEVSDVPTGSYFVVTDKDDNQIGSFSIGAMKYAKDLSIYKIYSGGKNKTKIDFVIIAPNDPLAMKKYVSECQALNLKYLYDPAFQIATFSAEELREGIAKAEILIGNDYEITLIEQKLEITHEELVVMVPILITTLGSKGSIIETRKEQIHIKPAKPKNESDPTGAGDAYRAGFIAGYLRFLQTASVQQNQGLTPDELAICGQMGSVAAAYTVEKYGTVTHFFNKEEFVKRYQENFGEVLKL